jgi:hypothetical protein
VAASRGNFSDTSLESEPPELLRTVTLPGFIGQSSRPR